MIPTEQAKTMSMVERVARALFRPLLLSTLIAWLLT